MTTGVGDGAAPLLETKLHLPRRRRTAVPRNRLRERLDRGSDAALTLVSAPAGFGKTTLLTEWLADVPLVAWVSLDEQDDDPARFWTYVLTAVDRAVPGAGAGALTLLASSPVESVLASLLNELSSADADADLVLVLDDLHAVTAPEIHDGLTFLIEHLPPNVHLVLASRADPTLPLARLRARGDLVEVRAADLRFTAEEAAAYLNESMDLALTPADVETLEARTEGWIAALQLAALSLRGRDDAAGFIAGFAGDDRYIVDYLMGEVLARQPDDVRTFLLQTSVLGRLSGELCDAVTGRAGSKATLDALDQANLFLVPLDDRRHWYRYHHLFADVLQARLLDEQPDEVDDLHRRAGDWFAANREWAEAIHHSTAADDVARVADLVELGAPDLRRARQDVTIRRWLDALPESAFADRPVLTVERVGSRMVIGDITGVEEVLDQLDAWLADPSGTVVANEETAARLPAQLSMYRAGLAHLRGDLAGTITHATRAHGLVIDGDHLGRGAARALLGLAEWSQGDLDRADRCYTAAVESMEAAGHLADVLGCTLTLADIRLARGHRRAAGAAVEQALALTAAEPTLRGTADMRVALSELAREADDLDAARAHLEAARKLGDAAALRQNPYRSRVAAARLCEAEGDLDGALALLDEAEPRYDTDYSPEVRPVAAVRARVLVKRGEVDAALRWARDRGLTVDDDLSYVREYEHLSLARALLAAGDDRVGPFLDRLLAAAEDGGRGSVVEILALQALDHDRRGDHAAALAALDRAISIAEPESFVRTFLDEGAPMAKLLAELRPGTAAPPAPSDPAGLVEPLSERELDVLRLLRSELSGPEIASQLIVSLNTVRTHTQHIYDKLGVNNRRAAVRRADELGL